MFIFINYLKVGKDKLIFLNVWKTGNFNVEYLLFEHRIFIFSSILMWIGTERGESFLEYILYVNKFPLHLTVYEIHLKGWKWV